MIYTWISESRHPDAGVLDLYSTEALKLIGKRFIVIDAHCPLYNSNSQPTKINNNCAATISMYAKLLQKFRDLPEVAGGSEGSAQDDKQANRDRESKIKTCNS